MISSWPNRLPSYPKLSFSALPPCLSQKQRANTPFFQNSTRHAFLLLLTSPYRTSCSPFARVLFRFILKMNLVCFKLRCYYFFPPCCFSRTCVNPQNPRSRSSPPPRLSVQCEWSVCPYVSLAFTPLSSFCLSFWGRRLMGGAFLLPRLSFFFFSPAFRCKMGPRLEFFLLELFFCVCSSRPAFCFFSCPSLFFGPSLFFLKKWRPFSFGFLFFSFSSLYSAWPKAPPYYALLPLPPTLSTVTPVTFFSWMTCQIKFVFPPFPPRFLFSLVSSFGPR